MKEEDFDKNYEYSAEHIKSGETWCIIGVHFEINRVAVAGYPPSLAKIEDFRNWKQGKPLDEETIDYRRKMFGIIMD